MLCLVLRSRQTLLCSLSRLSPCLLIREAIVGMASIIDHIERRSWQHELVGGTAGKIGDVLTGRHFAWKQHLHGTPSWRQQGWHWLPKWTCSNPNRSERRQSLQPSTYRSLSAVSPAIRQAWVQFSRSHWQPQTYQEYLVQVYAHLSF